MKEQMNFLSFFYQKCPRPLSKVLFAAILLGFLHNDIMIVKMIWQCFQDVILTLKVMKTNGD